MRTKILKHTIQTLHKIFDAKIQTPEWTPCLWLCETMSVIKFFAQHEFYHTKKLDIYKFFSVEKIFRTKQYTNFQFSLPWQWHTLHKVPFFILSWVHTYTNTLQFHALLVPFFDEYAIRKHKQHSFLPFKARLHKSNKTATSSNP